LGGVGLRRGKNKIKTTLSARDCPDFLGEYFMANKEGKDVLLLLQKRNSRRLAWLGIQL